MAGWETTATSSTFNTNEIIKNQMSGRQRTNDFGGLSTFESSGEISAFEDATSTAPDLWNWVSKIKEYSVVGIDGNQIETMRAAITAYVEDVQKYLENAIVATEDKIHGGLRGGEAEAAVKSYLDKVKEYVYNLVSTLNTFSDKLADVGNAWVIAQSQMGSSINTSTGAFSSGSAYVADKQYNGSSQSAV